MCGIRIGGKVWRAAVRRAARAIALLRGRVQKREQLTRI